MLDDNKNIDIVIDTNSKLEAIFITCIYATLITFIPMKQTYINTINQNTIIESQISNITNDFSILFETTKISLLKKYNKELQNNKKYLNEIMQYILESNFLENSFNIVEYFTYFGLNNINSKITYNFFEIISEIINFQITYNDKVKVNQYLWKDIIDLSIEILNKPAITNNNPHIRFSYLEIICYSSFDMYIGKNNINYEKRKKN